MLNLLLQPLVENAIVHGLDQRPDGGGILRITAAHKKDTIVFMVEDNGVGIDPQALPNLLTQDSGGMGSKMSMSVFNSITAKSLALLWRANYRLEHAPP